MGNSTTTTSAGNIFGYSWEAIQRAQQGGRLSEKVISKGASKAIAKPEDLDQLKKHGKQGLLKMELHGVLDRLRRAGHID